VPAAVRLGVLALAGLLAAGCAEAGPAAPVESAEQATAAVRAAYDRTVGAGTARVGVRLELTADVAGGEEKAELTGDGWFDFARRTSRTEMTTPLGLRIEVRTVGVDFYEKAPPQLRRRFPGQREWMRVDFEAADRAPYGTPLYVFRPTGPDDPWQLLGVLPAASGVEAVDRPELADGTPTRRYRATLRMADVAAQGGSATGPGRTRFQQKTGVDTVPLELWLDDAGRLRQLVATVPVRLAGADWTGTDDAVGGRATATLTFGEYGTPVSVSAPPAGATDDLTPLVSRRGLAAMAEIVGAV
jgi:hypothetical protein